MRIRMIVSMPEGATRDGVPWPAEGEETDLPTTEAAHLVAAGVAEEVDASAPRSGGRRKAGPKGVADGADGPDS